MKIKNQFCENVDIRPGIADDEENRAWQGVPSIAITAKGRLFAAFMSGGIYEPDPRNCVYVIASDDKGKSWTKPIMTINSIPEKRIRISDGELFTDPRGRLWLVYCATPYKAGLAMPDYDQKMDMENDSEYHLLEREAVTYASVCDNPDDDELVFSEPFRLFNAVMRNRPLFLKDKWIFPTFLAGERPYYELMITEDEGRTFRSVRIPGRAGGRAYDEPALWKTPDGVIVCSVRTTPNVFLWTFSRDGGETWTDPVRMMDAASQRPCSLTLGTGETLFIPSIKANARNGLRILLSADGIHFEEKMILDDRERISYPEAVESQDGDVFIIYDRERNNKIRKSKVTGLSEAAKEILFARIPSEAIRSGIIDRNTVRAQVISKARINALSNIYTK